MVESTLVNQWIAKGKAQGVIQTKRDDLLVAMKTRFKKAIPDEITRLINEQESLELLDDWFVAALRAKSYNAFLAVLKK